ncbi:helix-turn-helix transcriptional regulator [Microbacterium oryzae]|uniref:helix-turn-helix transcriptional regulator n=1 Tax=Microbacterium oryzae TaxID=743009 RepID=UPI0025AEF5F3|nr:WYL domain-containing protein [Microbacterium oryzae]
MAERIPAEERLMNLVVALVATEIGLTKQQILDSVSGYRQRAGARSDALDKMFERDKDELRALGVPLETIPSSTDPNDLREARYRIPKSEYLLPEDIAFTPSELAVLSLAGDVWSTGSLSADARSGLRKIRALGIDVDEPILGFAPRLTAQDPAFAPLQAAIEASRVVTFDYLKPGEDRAKRRTLAPLALVEYEGRWHVYGRDLGVSADRTFLLSRVTGEVVAERETFDPADREGAGDRALAGLEALAARQRALVEVTPGSEGALRLLRRATPARQGYLVSYVDRHIFADELASYGPEVRVVEPSELRDAVVERLRAAAAVHEGDPS